MINDRYGSIIPTGSSWPSRSSAGVKLIAVIRTFSKAGGRFACGNWMTTLTGRNWPNPAFLHVSFWASEFLGILKNLEGSDFTRIHFPPASRSKPSRTRQRSVAERTNCAIVQPATVQH